MESIEEVRRNFPIVKNKVFLNHAAHSPLPKPVFEAMMNYLKLASEEWDFETDLEEAKRLFAKLINAKPEEIAYTPNTSTSLNIVANMLKYGKDSNIVTTDLEFPSVVYPWLRKKMGVKVRYTKNVDGRILDEDFERMVDDKTAAIVVSHVEYANGFRNNLKFLSELAHEHGAFLVVDAIQSTGAIKVDVRRDDVDFLATACYKWLLGPSGVGFLYVKEELIEEFEPPMIGWASVEPQVFETVEFWDIWNLRLSKTASRFEVGGPNVIGCIGAAKALKLLLDYGIENIESRILALSDYLIERIKEAGWKLQTPEERNCRSGIVNFLIDNPAGRVEQLARKGIIVSARANGIRVSPHFYNTREEIDRLVNELLKQN